MCLKFALFCVLFYSTRANLPNVVLILTDDQDSLIGGLAPMVNVKKHLQEQGTLFSNAFSTTPVCCPSRASILTGQYAHNHKVRGNTLDKNCNGQFWQDYSERRTFATFLQKKGYKSFYAGKYLNQYGNKQSGGSGHVPPGWTQWFGLVGNSAYYNYTLSANGQAEIHGADYENDYLTDVVTRRTLAFIEKHKDKPFLAVLAPPSCHAPFVPAPQFSRNFSQLRAPRTPNFNHYIGKSKHWLLRQTPRRLDKAVLGRVDEVFRNRWRTLLSVDEMVEKLITQLSSLQLLDSTYVIFTSDHGYHLGQFGMPLDKRLPYEFDIRVPMIVRGPGIPTNTVNSFPVLTIDVAPTILEMAGIPQPLYMDGSSFLGKECSVNSLLSQRTFLVEYWGEEAPKTVDLACGAKIGVSNCQQEFACKCQDSVNNTYSCLRTLRNFENTIYCEFVDDEDFLELYDINTDPYQLDNLALNSTIEAFSSYSAKLEQLRYCQGIGCSGH